jgi:GntR family transcriptional regulator
MPRAVLDDAPVPLYEQLRRTLLAEIRDRGLAPGAPISTEAELGERFRVSRTVVRHALGELERQGHLTRIQGKGTFVSEPKVREHFLDQVGGLHRDLASRGHSLRSEVLACQERAADEPVALTLELPVGTAVVVLDRLRYVDGEPLVYTRSHLPTWLGADLREILGTSDLAHASLYGLLERAYGVRIVEAERTIEATAADPATAQVLGLGTGEPVLRLRSTARDGSGRVVEHYDAWHRGDRTLFELHVHSEGVDRAPRAEMITVS